MDIAALIEPIAERVLATVARTSQTTPARPIAALAFSKLELALLTAWAAETIEVRSVA